MKVSTSEKTSQRSHELERKITIASASVMDQKIYPSSKPITMNQGNRQIIKE
jgi:hypothetical protein